jgi:predicted DNA-binding transcriptional regulator AlpA
MEDISHLQGNTHTIKQGYVMVLCDKWKGWKPLHRYLLECHGTDLTEKVVHHRDGNRLNNRKTNLFLTTLQGNSKGKAGRTRGHANWKGYDVKLTSYGKTFKARIGVDYKSIQLGSYTEEIDAAIAYDLAALHHFGKDLAILNFPDRNYDGITLENWIEEHSHDQRPGTWTISKRKQQEGIKKVEAIITAKNVSVVEMARMCGYSRARFYQFIEQGHIPQPKKTPKGRPYFDVELQSVIKNVFQSRISITGEPLMLYNRKAKDI